MDIVFLAGIVITVLTAIPVFIQLRRGHPRGLFILFFAEMWERFSYYGMRGLLIFFMTQHLLFDDAFAAGRYGAYTALVYLLPLIGGFLADKYLGTRKAVLFGALLLVAGHFTMGIEGPAAQQVLTYNGQQYGFEVQGRMEARQARIIVDGERYEFGAGANGGFEIKGLPAGAAISAVLEPGSYQLSIVKGDPIYQDIFYLALALIIMGVGFLKANISTIVGQLYEQGDPRRDPGFTLYYYGINLGAFWAAIACGWLGTNVGWWAGFGAAGVGMALGFIVFGLGKPLLEGKGEPPDPEALKRSLLGPINVEWFIYIAGIIGVGLVWFVVQGHEITVTVLRPVVQALLSIGVPEVVIGDGTEPVAFLLTAGSVVVLAYIVFYMLTRFTFVEAQRMILALILIAASAVFFTLFEQAGTSLNQFAERNTQLNTGMVNITAAQTQSFNAGFILLLAPVFSALWAYLGRFNLDPNPALKFGLALVQVAAGFFVLVWGAQFADEGFRVPLIFLMLAYLFHTTGELCLSPVGLSQMTKLAPAVVVSTVMAMWFLASSWAQLIGSIIAKMTASETVAGQVLDPQKALATYLDVFQLIGEWGLYIGIGLIVLSPLLGYLAHEHPVKRTGTQPAE